jgi:hypothetical protein
MEHSDEKIHQHKQDIARILDMNPDLLLYEFRKQNGKIHLDLTTISPNPHKTKFLFHSTEAGSYDAALAGMHEYVSKHMQDQDTWQIRWHNPLTKTLEVSWFRAGNIMDALAKFYHDGKEIGEYKIYEVSLRPYA